jgi:hypothetical protein
MTEHAFAFSDQELGRLLERSEPEPRAPHCEAVAGGSARPSGRPSSEPGRTEPPSLGGQLSPSRAAIDLARRLGASYVEVVAQIASEALLGKPLRHGPEVRRVVMDVDRLARQLEDSLLVELNQRLPPLVDALLAAHTPEARVAVAQRIREWVLSYAAAVGGEHGLKLRRRMMYRRGVHALATHLRGIKGVGERRLDRLYRAGLLTEEALAEAAPDDLAAAAFIPRRLAHEIVTTCQRLCRERRIHMVKSFRLIADDISRALREAGPDPELKRRLLTTVRETMSGLESLIADLGEVEEMSDELE